jgi:hypothetical protein
MLGRHARPCESFLVCIEDSELCFSWSFCAIFVLDLFRRFEGVSIRISLRGSWLSALCLFVDDLDPSNAGFGLRFVDFWMNPRS